MTAKIINLEQIRALKEAGVECGPAPFMDDLPPSFRAVHCAAARAMLNWSVEALLIPVRGFSQGNQRP